MGDRRHENVFQDLKTFDLLHINEMYTSNNAQCILGTFKMKTAFDTASTIKREG